MSMVINLVEDHNIYLCEGGPVYNSGVQPTPPPITYLTQWQIVGNSEVHTLPYPGGVVLPTGYKRCKYLEFTGTQYFDSGILTSNDIGFETSFSTTTNNKNLIGARKDSRNANFVIGYFQKNGIIAGYGGVSSSIINTTDSPLDGLIHKVILDSTKLKFDNDNLTLTGRTASDFYNIFIGTWNVAGSPDSRCFVGKIYDVKIYNSTQTLGNFIPCLDDNNVPCLYDTVSQTTLYNQGTGTCGYEIELQPTEIWSCGEYNATDGKYHILVQPLGGSTADIALDEPLRKVNDVADKIEFPSGTEGKALVTRNLSSILIRNTNLMVGSTNITNVKRILLEVSNAKPTTSNNTVGNILCSSFETKTGSQTYNTSKGISVDTSGNIQIYDPDYNTASVINNFKSVYADTEVIYEFTTPTTELVDAPQIEEADSYSMVISQGGKAVEWSEFLYTINYLLTDSENNLLVDSENYQLTVQN